MVGFIDPVEFGVSASLRQITFIVVGGMGSVGGSVIGAAVLSALPEAAASGEGIQRHHLHADPARFPDLPAARPRDRLALDLQEAACRASGGRGPSMTDRLTVERLSVRFGGLIAVRDLSLRVAPGEIRGLIGPNGAGKTTVINAITGAVPIAAGRVLLDGTACIRTCLRMQSAGGASAARSSMSSRSVSSPYSTTCCSGVGRHAHVAFAHAAFATPSARRTEARGRARGARRPGALRSARLSRYAAPPSCPSAY